MSMISEQVKRLRKLANQWKHNDVAGCNLIFEAADTIEALSAKVRAADRPTGEWVQMDLLADRLCSICGYGVWDSEAEEYNFCPNCGARMVREDGEACTE